MKPTTVCCGLGAALFVSMLGAQAQNGASPMAPMPVPDLMPRTSSPVLATAAAMVVDGDYLYILRGDTLVKVDKNTLQIVGTVTLAPADHRPPASGGPDLSQLPEPMNRYFRPRAGQLPAAPPERPRPMDVDPPLPRPSFERPAAPDR